ncbi:MAG: hypothetical protein ABIN74_09255 [Ferruginibacter sp.]
MSSTFIPIILPVFCNPVAPVNSSVPYLAVKIDQNASRKNGNKDQYLYHTIVIPGP